MLSASQEPKFLLLMAFDRLGMTPLRQLLLLASQDKTRRQMVEFAHLSRRTVDGYIARFTASGFSYPDLLEVLITSGRNYTV